MEGTIERRMIGATPLVDAIARVCHEANRAYSAVIGDPSPLAAWEDLEETYRESSRHGVQKALDGATPQQLHESWLRERADQGWVYGETLDRAAKVHPCLVDYDRLPEVQRTKDALFSAIVGALSKE